MRLTISYWKTNCIDRTSCLTIKHDSIQVERVLVLTFVYPRFVPLKSAVLVVT